MNTEIFTQALNLYGEKEIPGKQSNPALKAIIDRWTGTDHFDDGQIAWCSMFVNDVAEKAGFEHTEKLNARSWLDAGEHVPLEEAQVGDVVVFWRQSPNSWKGHVAFYVRHDPERIWVLGGNQSNAVNIRAYDRSRLLGVRRLRSLDSLQSLEIS